LVPTVSIPWWMCPAPDLRKKSYLQSFITSPPVFTADFYTAWI
jgi:hypothetical protein